MSLGFLPADCPRYVTPGTSGRRKEVHKYTCKLCWQCTGKGKHTRLLQKRLWIPEHTVTVFSPLYSLAAVSRGAAKRKQWWIKPNINMKYFTEMRSLATAIIIRNAFQTSKERSIQCSQKSKGFAFTGFCLQNSFMSWTGWPNETMHGEQSRVKSSNIQDPQW